MLSSKPNWKKIRVQYSAALYSVILKQHDDVRCCAHDKKKTSALNDARVNCTAQILAFIRSVAVQLILRDKEKTYSVVLKKKKRRHHTAVVFVQ